MHGVALGPGPAAKLRAAVILHGLHDLLLCVHHKRAVLRHGLGDGLALQQQAFHGCGTGVGQWPVLVRHQLQRGVLAHVLQPHTQALARKEVQHAARALALRSGQCPLGAGVHAQRPDGHVGLGLRGPRLRGRRQRAGCPRQCTGHHRHRGGAPSVVVVDETRNALVPQHGEVRLHHLVACGQVQPDLEQLQRVGRGGVQQREHFGVHDALACGDPLHIAAAKPRCSAQRVGMVDEPLAYQRDGFETPVRVARKARYGIAVVHAPAVLAAEVAADLTAVQRHGGGKRAIARRVGVVMVCAEQKRIERGPQRAEGLRVKDGRRSGHGGAPACIGAVLPACDKPPAVEQCVLLLIPRAEGAVSFRLGLTESRRRFTASRSLLSATAPAAPPPPESHTPRGCARWYGSRGAP